MATNSKCHSRPLEKDNPLEAFPCLRCERPSSCKLYHKKDNTISTIKTSKRGQTNKKIKFGSQNKTRGSKEIKTRTLLLWHSNTLADASGFRRERNIPGPAPKVVEKRKTTTRTRTRAKQGLGQVGVCLPRKNIGKWKKKSYKHFL